MRIETRHETDLTPQDDAAIAGLLDLAFGQSGDSGFNGRSYYKQRHHLRVLGMSDGEVVGHIALLFRVVSMDGEHIPIVGLAEVATHPAHGGKGIASALLAEVVTQARATQAEFILLFGDHPIYARRGFAPAPNMLRYFDITEGRTTDVVERTDPTLKVMPIGASTWNDLATLDLLGHIF